jgi:hypothetical protein
MILLVCEFPPSDIHDERHRLSDVTRSFVVRSESVTTRDYNKNRINHRTTGSPEPSCRERSGCRLVFGSSPPLWVGLLPVQSFGPVLSDGPK